MQNYFHLNLSKQEIDAVSALGLAHIGDAVFELLVRSWLCSHGQSTSCHLHKATVSYVAAPAQAAFVDKLLPLLTDQERTVYKRGRNSHVHAVPKNATAGQYAKATGLECLLGAMYLAGQTERINELFVTIMEEEHAL